MDDKGEQKLKREADELLSITRSDLFLNTSSDRHSCPTREYSRDDMATWREGKTGTRHAIVFADDEETAEYVS